MAKLCLLCGSLCAYFLILFRITLVLSINDNFYSYETDSVEQYPITLQLVNSRPQHFLEKRAITSTESSNVTTTTTTVPPKTKSPKLSKTVSPTTTNFTKVPMKIATPKLLGVNGTGQRKQPIPIKPILVPVESTIAPFLHNDTIVNNFNQSTDNNDDISISKFAETDEELNKTAVTHHVNITRVDNHLYYNSTITTNPDIGRFYWIDLSNRTDAKISDLLSNSHRRAATVKLSFEFPFYGHLIKNVTIATGGFLYTGDYVHSWLAATQYIAPLMANFDTSVSDQSYIKYFDNGTAFTVEWQNVALQDRPSEGEFTFQTTLHQNGDIVFVYNNVPPFITQIEEDHHPVKIGLSDAYIIDRTIFYVRRKTIYEYHRVNFQKDQITNGTVIYLKALPTCISSRDCNNCLGHNLTLFKCFWCPSINRCSNGVDRHRQDWLTKSCEKYQIGNETKCSHISGADIFDKANATYQHDANEFQHKLEDAHLSRMYDDSVIKSSVINQPVKMGVSGIVAILFLLAMVAGLAVWVLYAYRNPHTTSGQILIRYRPSQWRWKRGEARYTAATIHM